MNNSNAIGSCTKAENMEKVWKFRSKGYSYREIAKEIGVSHVTVGSYIKQVFGELAEQRKELAEEFVEGEMAITDTLLKELLSHLTKERTIHNEDGEDTVIKEIDTRVSDSIIRTLDRRAKYLGLNAPEKKEITGKLTLEDLVSGSIIDAEIIEPKKLEG